MINKIARLEGFVVLMGELALTPAEYWQVIQRFYSASLSPQEVSAYRLAGVIAETKAREQGRSLLPVPWQQEHIPPTHLSDEVLIVLGLTALVLQSDEDRCESQSILEW